MEQVIEFAIVGAVLSIVVQMLKKKFGVNSLKAKLLTLVMALVFGTAYVWVRSTGYWESVIAVLASSSTVYGFILKK